jgi:GT2 family glycosyltransferase
VRQCVAALAETGAYEVGGMIAPAGLTPTGAAIAAATSSAFAVPGPFHTGGAARFTDTAYLGAWPRWVFAKVGGYDERLRANEDYELNYRIRQSGGKIYFSPAIRSTYYGRQTLGALLRQYFQYGRAKAAMLKRHPQSVRPRHLVAPAFVAGLVLGPLLAIWLKWLLAVWAAALAAYAALALLFAARAALRQPAGTFWRIPCVFAVVHVAWGAGFWADTFRHTRP